QGVAGGRQPRGLGGDRGRREEEGPPRARQCPLRHARPALQAVCRGAREQRHGRGSARARGARRTRVTAKGGGSASRTSTRCWRTNNGVGTSGPATASNAR